MFADTSLCNTYITINRDIHPTSASSEAFMNYETGITSAKITRTDNMEEDYGFSWKIRSKTNLCELFGHKHSKYLEASDTYGSMKWIEHNNNAVTTLNNWAQTCWAYGSDDSFVRHLTPQQKLKEILQKRQAPLVIVSHKTMVRTSDLREIRARETLRRVLGDEKFRSFIKKGFVSVRAKSGLVYQIFPAHGVTAVYRDGEMIERLCVVLRGKFPPTDSLIMRYLLILNDERDFRKYALKHTIIQKKAAPVVDDRPLTEIWKGLKAA